MTTDQAARILGTTRWSVIRRCKAGTIPYYRVGVKGRYMIDPRLWLLARAPKPPDRIV